MNKIFVVAAIFIPLVLMGCTQKLKVEAVDDNIQIQHPSPPPQIFWRDVGKIRVLNAKTLDEFLEKYDLNNISFIILTPKGYENLALNIKELKRYIEQQKEIILYYRRITAPEVEED